MRRFLPFVVGAFLLTGCSLAPKYETPELEAPDLKENNVSIRSDWYKEFNDPVLNSLVEEALVNNYDLLLAASNISQARAALGLAKADQYPTIAASGSVSKTTMEKDVPNNPTGKKLTTDSYSVSGVASYELDLWGKFRNSKKAALSNLLAMELTRETIRLSITAAVSESYFSLLMLEKNLKDINTLQRSKEESFKLRKKQYEVGAIEELLFTRIEADLHGTQAQLEQFTRSRDAAATALAVLVGKSPKEIVENVIDSSAELPDITISTKELPSDLIARRPDILGAEQGIKAANYNIGAARAAYFPTINLTGMMGYQSSEFGDLMKSGSGVTQLSGGVSVPLFTFGRIGAVVEMQKAGKEAAIVRYQQTIQRAFAEAYDAINRNDAAVSRVQSVTAQKNSLERALDLTRKKYEVGYLDYMEVVDAESAYLGASMNENGAKLERVNAMVNLYKALGGGWEAPEHLKN